MDAVKGKVEGNRENNEVIPFNTTTTTSTNNYVDETKKDSSEHASSSSGEARVSLGFVDDQFIGQLMPS